MKIVLEIMCNYAGVCGFRFKLKPCISKLMILQYVIFELN